MLLLTGSTGFIGGALAARPHQYASPGALAVPGAFGQSRRGRTRLASNLRLHGVSEQDLARLSPDQIICGDLTGVERWIDDPRLLQVNDGVNSAALASFAPIAPSSPPTSMACLPWRTASVAGASCAASSRSAPACRAAAMRHARCRKIIPGDDVEHYLDYTASKYEAEQRLRTELPELPLVVARPSIVVSHTELGCAASGSIYWVFRLARALQAFPANWIRRST
jgi:hypothetical protein